MDRSRLGAQRRVVIGILLLTLSACGGGGGGNESVPADVVRTLVYAPTECHEDANGRTFRQELRIQQNEGAEVTVTGATMNVVQDTPRFGGACRFAGLSRDGVSSIFGGGTQRLGVSPDGSTIVFERTNLFSVIGLPPLDPDKEGFFAVRADGTGLRHLGPPSRDPITRFVFDGTAQNGFRYAIDAWLLEYSADGRTVFFTDMGPGPDGEDAIQIVKMSVASGVRTQLTHLPRAVPANPPDPIRRDTGGIVVNLDGTVGFTSYANVDGSNPNGEPRMYRMKADGTDLQYVPYPAAVPGSVFDPHFVITGARLVAWALDFYGYVRGAPDYREIYAFDARGDGLQLTNFHRTDTGSARADVNGERVFFAASVDTLGSNPSESCQIFSIDRLGEDLQQLTRFNEGVEHSAVGCLGGSPPDCGIAEIRQDGATRAVLFASSCNVFGDNPYGQQLFAMNPDGTYLRALTHTRGFSEADGVVDVEGPGPYASSARPR